jgi:hypothetical protein
MLQIISGFRISFTKFIDLNVLVMTGGRGGTKAEFKEISNLRWLCLKGPLILTRLQPGAWRS